MPQTPFAAHIRELRRSLHLPLRVFCLKHCLDPGNHSRLERGLQPPPHDPDKLAALAAALGLVEGTAEWTEFFDRASAARGELPKDLLDNEEVVEKLPLLFRTLRGGSLTQEKLDDLVERIRRS